MFAPAVLIFEKRPRWGTELKRHLAGHRLFVRTHTSANELPPALTRFPSSVIVLDMTTDPAACLGLLGQVQDLNLPAKFLAITSPAQSDLEWPLREFSVGSIVPDTIRGEELALLCLRKLGIEVRPTPKLPAPNRDFIPPLAIADPLTSDL